MWRWLVGEVLGRHIARGAWRRDGVLIFDRDGNLVAAADNEVQAQRLVSAHNRDLNWYEQIVGGGER